ncbi:MAG: flavoprotein [Acidimicrobiales bacterium]
MPSFAADPGKVLYLVVCAAPPARTTTRAVIEAAQGAGWDASVVATPAAARWLPPGLAELTGHPVRSEARRPNEPRYEPSANAVLVAPATFHTINCWAAGLNDTLALGVLNEALGRSVPVAVYPWVNEALRAHPVFARNVAILEDAGVLFASVDPANPLSGAAMAAVAVEALGRVASPSSGG